MTKNVQRNVLTTIAAVLLAITYIACGFAVCAGVPQVTEELARATSNEALSPFSRDELVQAAVATRDYTVGSNDRDAVMEAIAAINDEANTRYAGASAEALAEADESYTLSPDALSHLDDVFGVMQRAIPALLSCAVLAGFSLMGSIYLFGMRAAGRPLAFAGGGVIAVFAALGLWAALDFEGLFAAFHALFFVAGTWTFPADSLLICMYPEAFWMGMGGIWLVTTLLLSILSLASGIAILRLGRHRVATSNARAGRNPSAQAAEGGADPSPESGAPEQPAR